MENIIIVQLIFVDFQLVLFSNNYTALLCW